MSMTEIKRDIQALPGAIGVTHLTFPTSYLEDQDSYSRVASLDRDQPIFVNTSEAARKRRDLAVEGFRLLCAKSGNGGSLESFYHHAISLVRAKEPGWRGIWKSGAVNATRRTEAFLDQLHAGVLAMIPVLIVFLSFLKGSLSGGVKG